jgi:hypothetical protein
MKEILRILKPGGKLMILGEGYKGGKHQDRNRKFLEGGVATYHSVKEISEILSVAGCGDIQIFVKYELDFICGRGTKPS